MMRRFIPKLTTKEYSVMKLHTKAGNITTDLKVKIDFNLSECSAIKNLCDIVM